MKCAKLLALMAAGSLSLITIGSSANAATNGYTQPSRNHSAIYENKYTGFGYHKPIPDSDGDGVLDPDDKCPGTPKGTPVGYDGCELDSDGDGVVDSLDKCPGTPAGATVNTSGCELDSDGDGVVDSLDKCPGTPAGATVNTSGCELDSDGDGVVDSLDKCPGTPAGATVNTSGCEIDSDMDGVVDSNDACPETPMSADVDTRGCWVLAVHFHTGSASITAESAPALMKAATVLKNNPEVRFQVDGHTDDRGSLALNNRLSQKRADSVRHFLVQHGAHADKLNAKGFGPSNPIATNDTAEGRQQNRRVELNKVK
ncbi:MAG: OmpA family protein [Magnetococcales bacterium]|nr:OmpA family protein [Magnetococcales bacterium]